jgi:hypothetical protein
MYRLFSNTHFGVKKFDVGKALVFCALVASFCPSALAATITGTVRNGSTGRPAAGDDVILLRLDQGMPEEGRTKTDSRGVFTLEVQYPDKPHLVRVVHQAVTYDRQVSAGDALSIDVFDAAPKVQGVTGGAEIVRVGTRGKLLHVSDMYDIKNESSPPRTQAGKRTFEFYLAAEARVDSVLAAGPGGIGVVISATPVRGQRGRYTVSFPLRPGDTKFAVNYNLPYDGQAEFHPRIAYPTQQLAVMLPPTMRFTSRSSRFHPLATGETDFQVQAANQLMAGAVPGFEISGTGALPPLGERPKPQAQSRTSPVRTHAGAASRSPGSPDLNKRDWLTLAVASIIIFVSLGFVIWRLRLRGSISAKDYTSPGRP